MTDPGGKPFEGSVTKTATTTSRIPWRAMKIGAKVPAGAEDPLRTPRRAPNAETSSGPGESRAGCAAAAAGRRAGAARPAPPGRSGPQPRSNPRGCVPGTAHEPAISGKAGPCSRSAPASPARPGCPAAPAGSGVGRLKGRLAPLPTSLQNPHLRAHFPDLHDAKSGLKPLGTGTSHGLPEGFPSDAPTVTWACRRIRKGQFEGGWSGKGDVI